MKAIFTRSTGGAVTATDGDGNRARVDDAALNLEDKHDQAARALCRKMAWRGTLAKGFVLKAGATVGRVYVWTNGERFSLDAPSEERAMLEDLTRAFDLLKSLHNADVKYAEALDHVAAALNWLEHGQATHPDREDGR